MFATCGNQTFLNTCKFCELRPVTVQPLVTMLARTESMWSDLLYTNSTRNLVFSNTRCLHTRTHVQTHCRVYCTVCFIDNATLYRILWGFFYFLKQMFKAFLCLYSVGTGNIWKESRANNMPVNQGLAAQGIYAHVVCALYLLSLHKDKLMWRQKHCWLGWNNVYVDMMKTVCNPVQTAQQIVTAIQ